MSHPNDAHASRRIPFATCEGDAVMKYTHGWYAGFLSHYPAMSAYKCSRIDVRAPWDFTLHSNGFGATDYQWSSRVIDR